MPAVSAGPHLGRSSKAITTASICRKLPEARAAQLPFFGYKSSTGRPGGAGKLAVLSPEISGISCDIWDYKESTQKKDPSILGAPLNFPTLGLGHVSEKRCWFLLRHIPGEGPPLEVKPRLSDMNYGFKTERFFWPVACLRDNCSSCPIWPRDESGGAFGSPDGPVSLTLDLRK